VIVIIKLQSRQWRDDLQMGYEQRKRSPVIMQS